MIFNWTLCKLFFSSSFHVSSTFLQPSPWHWRLVSVSCLTDFLASWLPVRWWQGSYYPETVGLGEKNIRAFFVLLTLSFGIEFLSLYYKFPPWHSLVFQLLAGIALFLPLFIHLQKWKQFFIFPGISVPHPSLSPYILLLLCTKELFYEDIFLGTIWSKFCFLLRPGL